MRATFVALFAGAVAVAMAQDTSLQPVQQICKLDHFFAPFAASRRVDNANTLRVHSIPLLRARVPTSEQPILQHFY